MIATVRRPDRSNPLPLWAQVLDDLRRRVGTGEFDTGFPPERDLIEEYGVSRHTMRDALGRLEADGVISRERGRGTFVQRRGIEQRTGSLYSLFRSIEDQGYEQRSVVLSLDRRCDPSVAQMLGQPVSTSLVYLHRLRFADQTPVAVDELWLRADVAAPLLDASFEHTAVYVELERRCGVRPGAGGERVWPAMPTQAERQLLDMPEGQPVFVVERTTEAEGQPLEWRRTVIRGDLFAFSSAWGADGRSYDEPAFSRQSLR